MSHPFSQPGVPPGQALWLLSSPPKPGRSHASVRPLCLCTMQGAQGWGVSPSGAELGGAVLPETLKLEGAEAPTVGAARAPLSGTCRRQPWRRTAEKCLWSGPC